MVKMCQEDIVPSFLIGSSSNLQVIRAAIKSRTSCISCHTELFASIRFYAN